MRWRQIHATSDGGSNLLLRRRVWTASSLLEWILAWAGLSAAWKIGDHIPPDTPLGVAELATAELEHYNI